jgi:SAM-dependent methyltransferase
VSPDRRYPLEFDETEVERYRTMAAAARQAEADLWEPVGIVPGAWVADVGCGPGAMLPALAAAAVGPQGRVVAVDAGLQAVTAATALVAAAALGNVAVQQGRAEETGLVDLQERYLAFRATNGDDNAAGMATTEDLRRWERAFQATATRPATFFVPMFTAVGRRQT